MIIMIKRYWYFYVLFLLSLAYIVVAYISKDDERLFRSIFFLLSLLLVLISSIIGDRIRKKNKLPSKVIKRMVVLFICSIAAILIGYCADYLIFGCIFSFLLGCVALVDVVRAK